jgi:hypothetical protein
MWAIQTISMIQHVAREEEVRSKTFEELKKRDQYWYQGTVKS